MKNAFAGPEWSVAFAMVAFLAIAFLTTGPLLVALLHPWPPVRFLGALGTLVPCMIQAGVARRAAGGSGLEGLTFPLCGVLLSGVVLYSTVAAVVRGGILWRGTFYSLEALRRGYVRRSDYPRERAVGWPRTRGGLVTATASARFLGVSSTGRAEESNGTLDRSSLAGRPSGQDGALPARAREPVRAPVAPSAPFK